MSTGQKKSFEQSMERLDEIVALLEENEQPLDATISLFEEGLELVKECEGKLKEFETRVAELTKQKGEDKE